MRILNETSGNLEKEYPFGNYPTKLKLQNFPWKLLKFLCFVRKKNKQSHGNIKQVGTHAVLILMN